MLREFLTRQRYERIGTIPLRAYPLSVFLLVNEIFNLGRFVTGRRNLFGVSLFPALYESITRVRDFRLSQLYDIFLKNKRVHRRELRGLKLDQLLSGGFFLSADDRVSSVVRVVPYRDSLFLTDPWDRSIEQFAYLSYDSFIACDLVIQEIGTASFERCLDVCCGVGAIGIALARHNAKHLWGIDINGRAIDYAESNAEMNDLENYHFLKADFFAWEHRGTFDLIVANPPFLDADSCGPQRPVDSYGGREGFEFSLRLIRKALDHLAENGEFHLITRAPFTGKKDLLLDRLGGLLKNETSVSYTYLSSSIDSRKEIHRLFKLVHIAIKREGNPGFRVRSKGKIFALSHVF